MAVRTLPQELGAPIAAARADMRIEVEHGVLCQLAVPLHQGRRVMKVSELAPDRLVNAEGMWVVNERGKEQIERIVRVSTHGQMA